MALHRPAGTWLGCIASCQSVDNGSKRSIDHCWSPYPPTNLLRGRPATRCLCIALKVAGYTQLDIQSQSFNWQLFRHLVGSIRRQLGIIQSSLLKDVSDPKLQQYHRWTLRSKCKSIKLQAPTESSCICRKGDAQKEGCLRVDGVLQNLVASA